MLGGAIVWRRPYDPPEMPLRVWALALHLRDSDAWLWVRVLGLEVNIPRR